MKKTFVILILILLVFGAAQFVRPHITNPPVTQEIPVPDSVMAVLKRSCFDCHSNQTRLKWFDKITPANFLVASDVRAARAAMNFSNWDSLQPSDQRSMLFLAVNEMRIRQMPLKSYRVMHPGASLDSNDVAILENYLAAISPRTPNDSITAVGMAVQKAARPGQQGVQVMPAVNGIRFFNGFDKWRALSTADRFETFSVRVIYGNEIAVKAVEEKKINPWPDGAVLAKSIWTAKTDTAGNITTGEFVLVDFMVKNSVLYASTFGWGFARFKGITLQPWGKDPSFAKFCMACHQVVRSNDFVFTYPMTPK
ncbi:MAG: heme-binding domain-containing protein [Chitinophagaceae bacterium]